MFSLKSFNFVRVFAEFGLITAVGLILMSGRLAVVQGHSMEPTLLCGQVMLVDTSYYRTNQISVGDVVVFNAPCGDICVKRVHAVAGQTICLLQYEHVEGQIVQASQEKKIAPLIQRKKVLGRLVHYCIPEGSFYALGDNTQESEDSRTWGPVLVEKIIGRVLPIGRRSLEPNPE